jgi:hypothetical protein
MNVLELLKGAITDPATLKLVLKLVLDLTDGSARLDADTRLEIQAELDTLTGGLV